MNLISAISSLNIKNLIRYTLYSLIIRNNEGNKTNTLLWLFGLIYTLVILKFYTMDNQSNVFGLSLFAILIIVSFIGQYGGNINSPSASLKASSVAKKTLFD
jgi:hypothetical protein